MKYNPITRRMFLQGAGGFMLAIPTLPSLLPRAYAQTATTAPMRFLILHAWYGRDYRKWYAHDDKPVTRVTSNGGYAYRTLSDLPGDISPILPASIWDTSLRKKMTLIRGLDVVDFHDGHNNCASTSASMRGAGNPAFPYSIDAVVEDSTKFYPTAPRVKAIRMAPSDPSWDLEISISTFSWTSKSGSEQDIGAYSWPHTVYRKFFTQTVVDEGAQRAGRLAVATNAAYEDYKKVMGSEKISTADRNRLDEVMQYYSQIQNNLQIQAAKPGGVCAAPASASGLPTDFRKYTSSSYIYSTSRDLMTVALACGMTKLCVLGQMLFDDNYGQAGAGNDVYHDCAHNPDGTKYGYPALKMNRYQYDNMAMFAKQLDSVQDVDGNTLLDNTLVFMANDDSTGAHELYDMPVILAGGKNVLRTDMMIDYRNTAGKKGENGVLLGRPMNNLLVTIFKALGLGAETYKVTGPDQKGYGFMPRNAEYTKYMPSTIYQSYYSPFLTDTAKDEVLPYVLKG